jgi:hypothetical protein
MGWQNGAVKTVGVVEPTHDGLIKCLGVVALVATAIS